MPSLVYACKFHITSSISIDDILSRYAFWISSTYERRKQTSLAPKELLPTSETQLVLDPIAEQSGHRYKYEQHRGKGNAKASLINWSYPSTDGQRLIWKNSASISQFSTHLAVSHLITIESSDFIVTPAYVEVGSPRIIQDLCENTDVTVGQMKIRGTVYPLTRENLTAFEFLLTSVERALPLVLLTPYADGDPNLIDASDLARRLAGVAVVVQIDDIETTHLLTQHLGKELSCFDGAARIYWPGFSFKTAPRKHPLFFGAKIAFVGADRAQKAIERKIFTVTSFRYLPDADVEAIIRESQEADRARRLEETSRSNAEETFNLAIEIDRENQSLKEKVRDLEIELSNVRAIKTFELLQPQETTEEDEDDFSPEPTTVAEAVSQGAAAFKKLEFLESAYQSAVESPYKVPSKVFAALRTLNEVATLAYPDSGPRPHVNWEAEVRKRFAVKRYSEKISPSTKTRFENEYTFLYEGRPVLFEPHITLGAGDANSCASIHFIRDKDRGILIIAHVGRHLPNMNT